MAHKARKGGDRADSGRMTVNICDLTVAAWRSISVMEKTNIEKTWKTSVSNVYVRKEKDFFRDTLIVELLDTLIVELLEEDTKWYDFETERCALKSGPKCFIAAVSSCTLQAVHELGFLVQHGCFVWFPSQNGAVCHLVFCWFRVCTSPSQGLLNKATRVSATFCGTDCPGPDQVCLSLPCGLMLRCWCRKTAFSCSFL